jgi:hypothetical protein
MEGVLAYSMSLVRRRLVLAVGADSTAETVLLGDDYEEPRGLVPALFVLQGELALKDPTKPPPPDLGASFEVVFPVSAPSAIEVSAAESLEIKFHPNITFQLPDNISASNLTPGLRAAHIKTFSAQVDSITRQDTRPGEKDE